jgi:hypothetical protein
MDGWMYFHHPSFHLHPKKSTKNLQSLSLQRGAIRYRNWARKRPAASAKKYETVSTQKIYKKSTIIIMAARRHPL